MIFVLPASLFARRAASPVVMPLEYNGIKYVANEPLIGYVSAIDIKMDTVLWITQVYKIIYDHSLGANVQDIFINSMKREKNVLIITNENRQTYRINLKSGTLLSPKGIIDLKKNRKSSSKLDKNTAIKIAWERYVEIIAQNNPEMSNKELYFFHAGLKNNSWCVNISMKAEDVVGGGSFCINSDTGKIEKEDTY